MSSHTRNQYFAGLGANIISISYGGFVGWASASFLELDSLIGDNDKFGRKRCLVLHALPGLLGWLIIPFATTPLSLCASRFLGGFSGGGTFSIIPIYTAELSDDKIRGTLGTFLVLFCNFGVLLAFVLGNYLSCRLVAWILLSLPVLFLLVMSFVPESPSYLANKNDLKGAERSLCYFRNVPYKSLETLPQIKLELQSLVDRSSQPVTNLKKPQPSIMDFVEPRARKALIIGIILMAINQFSGCFVMLNYTATIFKQAGSNLPPNESAIVVGVIQLLGSYASTLLVERAGRKVLLIVSALGTSAGLICLGGYMWLDNGNSSSWIPVASFSFIIFIGCWGVITLPFIVVAEIMPPKVRSLGCMLCMLSLWTYSFFLLKFMGFFTQIIGMHGLMFAFSACSFMGAVFIGVFVPETKGKSVEEILNNL
ncbi:facilitated trehalose transporter Tret1 isoform X2 [Stomoxys calcitrans]|uniref:facilitated trehalose transporter Tret1 isoform X2 n=1 Tax=Stomoxys calcitrans TaxID=35570 RepID=UPI0027E30CED|nr:facilitated trehalose transporter Tret1 isoform X2 [Stomoxys calcitrans]